MNKRDLVLSLLTPGKVPEVVPAAFFLHFNPAFHRGQPAVEKHLEYFRYTGMDFVKIQYENSFPHLDQIQRPEDWENMPFYGLDFYEGPLGVVKGLVKEAKKDALIVLTLYSPFMCAGHSTSEKILTAHMQENPEQVKRGMQIITDSLMGFVKECIRLGLDGFYTSTQGGEADRFTDPGLFDACVRPYDLALMEEIDRNCLFNILHVCDYSRPYADISRFVDYPGKVVNCNLELTGKELQAADVEKMFGRPYMGGLNRKGTIARGTPDEIRAEVRGFLSQAPERVILGADCTVPGDTSWDNLKIAIDAAHSFRK